jgi:hypothetical protein
MEAYAARRMVRVRRGTGVERWIRARARMKWKASMRFDGGEVVSAPAPLVVARRLGLGFSRGVGGEGSVLFAAMKPGGQQIEEERWGNETIKRERRRSALLKRQELWLGGERIRGRWAVERAERSS